MYSPRKDWPSLGLCLDIRNGITKFKKKRAEPLGSAQIVIAI